MDGSGDDLIGWTADGVAAGILGSAIGACLLMLGLPEVAVGAASLSVLLALTALRRVKPEPRRFRLPSFTLDAVPPEVEVLELTEMAAEEPLLLADPLPEPEPDSRVVQLFAPRPLPTPGELARRIDDHLEQGGESRGGRVLDLEVDAAAALRQALGDLRRSLA
jgi:hypothetical protein